MHDLVLVQEGHGLAKLAHDADLVGVWDPLLLHGDDIV
jgi:hypothetical protein